MVSACPRPALTPRPIHPLPRRRRRSPARPAGRGRPGARRDRPTSPAAGSRGWTWTMAARRRRSRAPPGRASAARGLGAVTWAAPAAPRVELRSSAPRSASRRCRRRRCRRRCRSSRTRRPRPRCGTGRGCRACACLQHAPASICAQPGSPRMKRRPRPRYRRGVVSRPSSPRSRRRRCPPRAAGARA